MKPRSSPFSPRLLGPELLEQLTVGREDLLVRLVGNLSAAVTHGQGRFDLLVGPRGVGKSHMLGLVEARVRASQALQGRLVVVSLSEEFHPSSLLHLLAKVLEGLPEDPARPPISAQLPSLRRRDASEAIDMAVAMIRERLEGRSLLLMVENLDGMFRDLGRQAQARLRKIVQTEPGWSIFATARSAIALSRQSEPFHGTFVVEHLDTLTPAQCREMMIRLAEVHEQAELGAWLTSAAALTHVRAAHHLVGGSPRVVALLFHHLDVERLDDFEGDFFRLAEEVTPYFQEQMGRLSAGQRPVMEFLAERWAPASVTEIAEGTYSAPTTVSTHLRALRRDRLVHSLAVGKERFYEIAEPLHRIARAMKQDKRLGAAIARMARVWALLGAKDEPVEFSASWLVGFCEGDSEYVGTVVGQLAIAARTNDLAAVEEHVDVLSQHVQGHYWQGLVVFFLLWLGRDGEALQHAKVMADADLGGVLGGVYLIWLGFSEWLSCPVTEEFLARSFVGAKNVKVEYVREFDEDSMGKIACKLAGRLGIDAAKDFLETQPGGLRDEAMSQLALIAWLRGELPRLLEGQVAATHLNALRERHQAEEDLAGATVFFTWMWCEALEDATRTPATTTPALLAAAVRNSSICITLWIASGRDIPTLRRALQDRAGDLVLLPAFEHALAAEDSLRAFTRLGAEARAFARYILRVCNLNDLLARLPPEPEMDPG